MISELFVSITCIFEIFIELEEYGCRTQMDLSHSMTLELTQEGTDTALRSSSLDNFHGLLHPTFLYNTDCVAPFCSNGSEVFAIPV